jgi:hypothetical protein
MKTKSIKDSLAVLKNSLRVKPEHFESDLTHAGAVKLFKDYVELVEVETTSYCNRTCSFCPNSFLDRHTVRFMPEECWSAILDGLREANYKGTFVWSRYAEPLSERRIIDRIKQVREAAPASRICVNSNGDYLDVGYLKELEESGLDRLWIDVYIPDEEIYTAEVAKKHHDKFLNRIGRSCSVTATAPEYTCKIESQAMEITSHVRNLAVMMGKDMSDRGGLVELARRTVRDAPCYAPFKHLVIDWDGSIVICCQLRSDSPSHQAGVVGKIGADGVGLVDAYVRLAKWRSLLRSYGSKKGPCATCNVSEYKATRVVRKISDFLVDTDSSLATGIRSTLKPMLRKKLRP